MLNLLEHATSKPVLYSQYTIEQLWNHPHVSKYMLEAHLSADNHLASRKHSFIDKSVKYMIDRFKLGIDSNIIDFGCGPGLYTSRLAKSGIQVTGVDLSINSISYAREQAQKSNLKINYINTNYLEYKESKQYDLITMIYCDFCAISNEQRKQLLGVMKSLMNKESRLLLDVYTMRLFEVFEEGHTIEPNQTGGFWREAPYYDIVSSFKYDDVTLEKHSIYSEEENFEVYNWLKCYSKDTIVEEFKAEGLEVVEFSGDVAGGLFDVEADTMAMVVKLV